MKNIGMVILLSGALQAPLACGFSNAKPGLPEKPVVVEPSLPDTHVKDGSGNDLNVGTFSEGYALGSRNGSILIDRMKQATIGTHGCSLSEVRAFEKAVAKVTRNIVPPATRVEDRKFLKGFYRGYLDALKSAVEQARLECKHPHYTQGQIPGELYGSLFCQVASIDLSMIATLGATPLYPGWSGGQSDVELECVESVHATLEQCIGDGVISQEVSLALENSCVSNL